MATFTNETKTAMTQNEVDYLFQDDTDFTFQDDDDFVFVEATTNDWQTQSKS